MGFGHGKGIGFKRKRVPPPPLAAPVNTVDPFFVKQTPDAGDVITSSAINPGTWTGNPPPSFAYALTAGGVAKSMPYTVLVGDVLGGTVTASNSQGTSAAEPIVVSNAAIADPNVVSTDSTTAAVANLWSAGQTTDGITVIADLAGAATDARLVVSTSSDLSSPVYSAPVATDADNLALLSVSGLAANTVYHYGIRVGATIYTLKKGKFKTLPASAASFKFAFSSCGVADTNNASVYQNIKNQDPLLYLALGDTPYLDHAGAGPTVAHRLATFRTYLASNIAGDLYKDVPTYWTWSDHDYYGDPASGVVLGDTYRAEINAFYRKRAPHAPLARTDDIGQSLVVGRVRFVMMDARSKMSNPADSSSSAKTKLGLDQRQWVADQITAAASAGQFVVLSSDVPFVSGGVDADTWWGFQYERTYISDHIKAQAMEGRVIILGGDAHMIAYGMNDYATGGGADIWNYQAGALNNSGSTKGGPWTASQAGTGQYAIFDVTDAGGDTISLRFRAYSSANAVVYDYTQTSASLSGSPPADVTAPTLTTPVGTQTGETTATIGATTTEADGTLYGFVSTSATAPSAADLKAGTGAVYAANAAGGTAGAKTFSATGLTAATTYYAHLLHRDAAGNDSAIVTSTSFTTAAAAGGFNPALVQTKDTTSNGGTSVNSATMAFNSPPTLGNMLIVFGGPDKNNSFNTAGGTNGGPPGFAHIATNAGAETTSGLWWKIAQQSDIDNYATGYTITWSGANQQTTTLMEMSGIDAVDVFDQNSVQSGINATTFGPLTTTVADTYVMIFGHTDSGAAIDNGTQVFGESFALIYDKSGVSGAVGSAPANFVAAKKLTAIATALNVSWSYTGGADGVVAHMVAFKKV